MPFDLALTSPSFATGLFGQCLSGGYGLAAGVITGTSMTIEAWVKVTGTGVAVAAGQGAVGWIGRDASGKAVAHYGNTPDVTLSTSVAINDNTWHHLALVFTTTGGGRFYVDGVLAASSSTTVSISTTLNSFGVRAFQYAGSTIGFNWPGQVDEVAVWLSEKYTADFTPAPISNLASGLRAVWHLNNDGTDSQGVTNPATAVTMTGPTSGIVGVASTNFTVGANGDITGTVVVTPSDGGGGGTFTPTSVSISAGSPTGTFTYTPATTGAKTISVTNDGGLSNPSNITYTAGSAATVPGAPTIGTATAGNAQATVTFTAPASDGGSSITGYTVTSSPGSITATGATSPITVTGLTNGTAYTFTVHATNSIGNSAESAASNSVTPTAGTTNAIDTTKIVFSPYNWNIISGTSAKTINGGAYFRTIIGGGVCTLTFDMTGVLTPVPKVRYRIDKFGPWTEVDLAASIALTFPTATSGYASHVLEFEVRSTSEAVSRWSPQGTAILLTGIYLATGKTLAKPPELPLRLLFLGDSITDGINAITSSGDATLRGDATLSYASVAGKILGAEYGVVGFGGQGWSATGGGSVPIFGSTYNYIYSGASRSFSPAPDAIIINQGQNDGSNSTTSAVTAVLNGLIAATPKTTKIIVLRPFSGNQAANLQAGIAACNDPSRITYINTTGFYNSANSSDTVHPYGWEHITHIGPAVADAIRPLIQPLKGTRTARTVSVTFENRSGVKQANLTGLKWSWFDQATPNALTVAADSGIGTTDANGVFTTTVYTTLAAGATGWLQVGNSDGTATQADQIAFAGPVVVT